MDSISVSMASLRQSPIGFDSNDSVDNVEMDMQNSDSEMVFCSDVVNMLEKRMDENKLDLKSHHSVIIRRDDSKELVLDLFESNSVTPEEQMTKLNYCQVPKRKLGDHVIKLESPMITIVEGNETDSVIDPLVHTVSENTSQSANCNRTNTHCFLCNAKLAVSARGAVDVLDENILTSHRQTTLSSALSDILHQQIDPNSDTLKNSSLLCKKCYRELEDHDALLSQIESIKMNMIGKLINTKKLIRIQSELENDTKVMKTEDPEFQVYMSLPDEERKCNRGKRRSRVSRRGAKRKAFRHLDATDMDDVDDWNAPTDAIHMTINSSAVEPSVEVREMNGVESGHHFLDINSDSSIDVQADEVLIDCLHVRDEEEHNTPTMNLNESIKDLSPFSRILFALPVDGSDLVASTWERFKCLYCNTTSRLYDEIVNHIKESHKERLYNCELCSSTDNSKSFKKRTDLIDHLQDHLQLDARNLKCNSCPKRFILPSLLRQHKKHHLAKTVQCPHCSRRFKTDTALQEHQYTHSGVRPFKCDQCPKRFSARNNLKLHSKTHSVRERKFKCEICSKEFLQLQHLMEHNNIHSDVKSYICPTCGKGFTTTRSLDLHMVIHSGVKNYICKVCGKEFARKGELEDHDRVHTGEKPFQCEICGATFGQRSNLQSHKRATHYKEKKHSCEICNKAFKRRRLLSYHMMSVHTGERPYKCSECNAAFVYPEHYKKHMRIHTGEKPFSCDICGKSFNSRDNRNAHKFIHSERKPYECTICNAGFMRKPMVLAHIMQHDASFSNQPEMYVRVNPPSVADESSNSNELNAGDIVSSNTLQTIKMYSDNCDDSNKLAIVNPDTMETMAVVPANKNFQLIDTGDLSQYILQNNNRGGSFLASFQTQVVEVRQEESRDDTLYEFSEEGVVGYVDDEGSRRFELQLDEGNVEEVGEAEEMELTEGGEMVDGGTVYLRDKL